MSDEATNDLKVARIGIFKLGETFKQLQSHSLSILTLSDQWQTLQNSFGKVQNLLESRVKEFEAKNREIDEKNSGLENMEKEVELKKKELEFEEKSLRERSKNVEIREKQVKDWCECLDLEKRGIDERFNEVKLREKRFLERFEKLRTEEERWKAVEETEKVVKERESECRKREETCSRREDECRKREEACREWEKVLKENLEKMKLGEKVISGDGEELNSREKQLNVREKDLSELSEELKSKEGELNRRIEELEQKEVSIEAKRKKLEANEKQFDEVYYRVDLLEKEMIEKDKMLESKEKMLELKEREIKEQKKALESREKELDKRSREITEKKSDESESSLLRTGGDAIHSLCKNMDAFGLRSYLIEHFNKNEINTLNERLTNGLKCAPDPAKLVLYFYQSFHRKFEDKSVSYAYKNSCIFLLEQFMKLSLPIAHPLKDEALHIASLLKACLKPKGNTAEDNYGYLLFVAAFRLATFCDSHELISLFGPFYSGQDVYRHEQQESLCRALGLSRMIPDVIKSFIGRKKLLTAIKYTCVFKLEYEFPIAPLLEAHLDSIKNRVNQKLEEGTFQAKLQANGMELGFLNDVTKVIAMFKLESIFPPKYLLSRISELELEKEKRKPVASQRFNKRSASASPSSSIASPKQLQKRPKVGN